MEEGAIYIDKLNLFGINIQFQYRNGAMIRICPDPNAHSYGFEPLPFINPLQWVKVISIHESMFIK